MQINEIFASIDGEGSRTGYLVTFIRSFACNLHCSYCDTLYAVDPQTEEDKKSAFKTMSISEIVDECKRLGNHRITFTGGEPLIQKDAAELVIALLQQGFEVNIETNGAVDLVSFNEIVMDKVDGNLVDSLFYTLDYKCPSSGMEDKMILHNLEFIGTRDVLKFVVGNEDDLNAMLNILTNYNIKAEIFVSPVFGDIEGKDIVKFMQQHNLQNVRVQVQLHKYFWPVDMRGV